MARLAPRLETAVRTAPDAENALVSLRYLLARVYLDEQNAVKKARKEGMTWARIGELLHMTESGVRRKYMARGIQ